MKRILVWDIPTRLFHWSLAALFLTAFGLAQIAGEHSPAFAIHMILGLVIGFMIVLRLVWGLVGSRYARFSSFLFGPASLVAYLKEALTGGTGSRYVGHNPGSSYAIYAMLLLPLGLVVTGLLMSSGGELFEELHEVLAYGMIAVVGAHVAGVIWHMIRHRENIVASMVHGRKEGEPEEAIRSARPLSGVVFLAATGFWAGSLFASHDPTTNQVTIPLIGKTVVLGEGEEGEHGEHGEHGRGGGERGERRGHEEQERDDD